jgi:hypothetical protein
MAELAAEVSKQTGKVLAYADLPPDAFRGVLAGAGLRGPFVDILVTSTSRKVNSMTRPATCRASLAGRRRRSPLR